MSGDSFVMGGMENHMGYNYRLCGIISVVIVCMMIYVVEVMGYDIKQMYGVISIGVVGMLIYTIR